MRSTCADSPWRRRSIPSSGSRGGGGSEVSHGSLTTPTDLWQDRRTMSDAWSLHPTGSRVRRPDDRMTRRSLLIALGAGTLTAPLRSFAQPRSRVWRIGYLDLGSRRSLVNTGRYAAFVQGMRELGRTEGKDFLFEARFAEGS